MTDQTPPSRHQLLCWCLDIEAIRNNVTIAKDGQKRLDLMKIYAPDLYARASRHIDGTLGKYGFKYGKTGQGGRSAT